MWHLQHVAIAKVPGRCSYPVGKRRSWRKQQQERFVTRAVILIVDGMGDLPVPGLAGLTPLEAAHTPHLDHLAATGLYGLIDPIAPGEIPNTDSGTGLLMGLQPRDVERLRRGPVEAAGAGSPLKNGDVAMRANFATVQQRDGQWWVTDRRAGRIDQDVPELIAALEGIEMPAGVTVNLRHTEQHRAVLVLSADGLDGHITDTDPGDEVRPAPLLRSQAALPARPAAHRTAGLLNQYLDAVNDRLQHLALNRQRMAQGKLPANALITRGAGQATDLGNVIHAAGLSAAVVSGCNTVRGLASLFGYEVIRDPRFTATKETDIAGKVDAAIQALRGHDLVFVHFKAPDLFAHDRDPHGKKMILERFDAALAPLLQQQVIIGCAADHSTDSNSGRHTADPVPALLFLPGRNEARTPVKFGETACRSGNLPRQNSSRFIQELIGHLR
jgi:2,3-bisphosphoglycerate-independent phosphoglycerate mutase